MLALWMFGTELERTWGTRFFTKYYFVTGVGAAATSLLLSLFSDSIYYSRDGRRVGRDLRRCCSPTRCTSRTEPISVSSSRSRRSIFVMIVGAIAFISSIGRPAAASRIPRTSADWWSATCI